MKNSLCKVISVLLAVVMLTGVLSVPALAASGGFSLAPDRISQDDNDPIIFIPGIMGSRLYKSRTVFNAYTRIWDPIADSENVLSLFNINAVLTLRLTLPGIAFVRPCEEQHQWADGGNAMEYGREYGSLDTYKPLIDGLCDAFPDRGVYFFSYDWRKSNDVSAQALKEAVDKVLAETGASKVDLLAHSMGGLVTSAYYGKYSALEQTDKIITCGTPYEGSPTLLNSVLTPNVFDNDIANFLLRYIGGLSTPIKASFAGVAELTPTQKYVNKVPMMKVTGERHERNITALSYDEYDGLCRRIFGNSEYDSVKAFQASIKNDKSGDGYANLLDYPNSYFILGYGQQTISSVTFRKLSIGLDNDMKYTLKGDGTVPFLSASSMENVMKLDSGRWRIFNTDHQGTAIDEKPMQCIEDFLEFGKTDVNSDKLKTHCYTVIRINGKADVEVSAAGKEKLEYSERKSSVNSKTSFGRLDLAGTDADAKLMCLSTGDYVMKVKGRTSEKTDITVRSFNGNDTLLGENTFSGVEMTPDTVITVKVDANSVARLLIDNDGDGIADEIMAK